jgi:Uma2 family endonuclease
MVAVRQTARYTATEYLELEQQAETKSEYIDGFIVAMSGASPAHNHIALDVVLALAPQLRGGPCDVYALDMRVRNIATERYTYPDVLVVCGEQMMNVEGVGTLLNPTLIVEVLSPSTEAYDRGDKFADYRRMPSLQEYVLIAQDRVSVEHYLRQGEQWLLTAVADLDGAISLPTVSCVLQLRDVYRRVRFDAPAVPDATS